LPLRGEWRAAPAALPAVAHQGIGTSFIPSLKARSPLWHGRRLSAHSRQAPHGSTRF